VGSAIEVPLLVFKIDRRSQTARSLRERRDGPSAGANELGAVLDDAT